MRVRFCFLVETSFFSPLFYLPVVGPLYPRPPFPLKIHSHPPVMVKAPRTRRFFFSPKTSPFFHATCPDPHPRLFSPNSLAGEEVDVPPPPWETRVTPPSFTKVQVPFSKSSVKCLVFTSSRGLMCLFLRLSKSSPSPSFLLVDYVLWVFFGLGFFVW